MPTARELIVLVASIVVALLIVEVVRRVLTSRVVSRWPLAPLIVRRCVRPGFAVAFVAGATAGLPPDSSLGDAAGAIRRGCAIAVIASVTWLIVQAAFAATDGLLDHLVKIDNDRRVRRMRTQVMLLRRTAAAIMVIIAVASILFTFPPVRAVGAGLLASAGLVGIVAGIAAQSTLGNVFAGLQLAFSDALRIDDVVVVEEQWGRVEELTLTYVVLRLWDERRLVLPVSYFAQNAFENWTRRGSRVIGNVVLNVDWSVPIEELRTELYRYLREHPLWDQKEWVLQAIDVLPNGLVQIRALMSAQDSASAYDLRCDVREHLIRFVREKYPEALPRFRTDVTDQAR